MVSGFSTRPDFGVLTQSIRRISPSTLFDITLATSSTTSFSPSLDRAVLARPKRKSPPRIESLFPPKGSDEFCALLELLILSCRREAICIISTICASRICVGRRMGGDIREGLTEGSVDGNGGGNGRGVGRCTWNTLSNDAVLSGILGFDSFKAPENVRGRSSSSDRPELVSQVASQCFCSQHVPRPFVARANRRTRSERSCFDGCRK